MNSVPRLAALFIPVCIAMSAHADRYYTWIDENGEVRHTLISEPAQPEKTTKNEDNDSEPLSPPLQVEERQRQATPDATEPGGLVSSEYSSDSGADRETREELSGSGQEELGIVESKSLVNAGDNKPKQETPLSGSANSKGNAVVPKGASPHIRRFEGEDYVDAENLEAQGVAPAKPQRFYTVIDSDGSFRNIPYPEDAQITTQSQVQPVLPESFQIVAKEQVLEGVNPKMQADSYAVELFGLDSKKREIDIVADHCCEALKTFDRVEFDLSEGNLLEINERDYSYQFGLGASLLRILSLPDMEEELTFGIRTYAGPKVFYPSVLVLDEEFKPQRLIQDIVYVYEPENWFRYGYLEGFFKVDLARSRYLVIFTTKDDERKRTVVEGIEDRPIVMNHAGMGIVHVSRAGVAE